MTMKLEASDTQSNHSDYSCDDSQSSQESANDNVSTVPNSRSTLSISLVPYHLLSSEQDDDDSLMFSTMFDYEAEESGKVELASLEGLNSGVPTRTTATITPTQLRNFEQTYIELSNCRSDQNNHVGFVPPSITQANHYGIVNPQVGWGDCGGAGLGSGSAGGSLHVSPGPLSASGDSSSSPGLPAAPRRRNMGGRRPAKTPHDITPEEEERRQIRRERNKMAAARCRKRRVDQTNQLQMETEALEAKKAALNDDILKYQAERDHLQAILNNHRLICRLGKRSASPPDIKPQFQESYVYTEDGVRVKVEVADPTTETIDVDPVLGLDSDIFTTPNSESRIMLSAANPAVVVTSANGGSLATPPVRPNRPCFLQVPLSVNPAHLHNNKALAHNNHNKIAGIEITTPSNGIPFNFESLMEGGTGLTPVHPHPCAAQQRSAPDLVSPDSHNNSSLVSL